MGAFARRPVTGMVGYEMQASRDAITAETVTRRAMVRFVANRISSRAIHFIRNVVNNL